MKRVLQFVCIFLLLFAQQSALTHAAWHAGQQQIQLDSKDKVSFQGSLCDLHAVFGTVLGGAHASPVHQAAQSCIEERIAQRPRPLLFTTVPTPLSRGPPALL